MKLKIYYYFLNFLMAFLPISLILGTAVSESVTILIIGLFFWHCPKEKKFLETNSLEIKLFILLWIYLILNSLLGENWTSFIRGFFYFRYFILVIAIKYFLLKNLIDIKKVFIIWLSLCLIVTFDIYYELYNGFNILGYKSNYPGRVASFFNTELKVGGFYVGFVFLSLTIFFIKEKKYYKFLLLSTFFLITSYFIGERSNFLKFLFIYFFINIYLLKYFLWRNKKKILLIIISIILVFSFDNYNLGSIKNKNSEYGSINKKESQDSYVLRLKNLNSRYHSDFFYGSNIKRKYINSAYGEKFLLSKEMLKNNFYFGVGAKNYRNVCPKYKSIIIQNRILDCSTHPHQIYYELLTEHGILGTIFIIFILFILILKNFKFNKFYYLKLASILYIIANFLPLIPSGSFFTSFNSLIFWVNFALWKKI
jgi:O-antigen ligase